MPAITSPIHFLSISGTSIIGRDTDKLFVYTFLSKKRFVVGWYIYLFLLMSFKKRNLNEFCLQKSPSHALYLHNAVPYTSRPILLINDMRSVRSRSDQLQ